MVLTNSEFTKLVGLFRQDPTAMSELKNAAITKSQLRAGFDAVNDDYEARRLTIKELIDADMGTTTTNAFAKKLGKAWLNWKTGGE